MSIKDVGAPPHEPRVVAVTTGSEARPAGPAPVIWAGGTTQPTNMTAVDFWFKANTAGTIPAGGTTGQVLKKNSATNYDAGWQTDETGSGGGGNFDGGNANSVYTGVTFNGGTASG